MSEVYRNGFIFEGRLLDRKPLDDGSAMVQIFNGEDQRAPVKDFYVPKEGLANCPEIGQDVRIEGRLKTKEVVQRGAKPKDDQTRRFVVPGARQIGPLTKKAA